MRILVVVGECLLQNSSANLCHLKYIEGLTKAGHAVDLLTVSKDDLNIDSSMKIPEAVNRIIEYKDSLYKRKGEQKKKQNEQKKSKTVTSGKQSLIIGKHYKKKIKSFIRKLYGPYSIETGWMIRALRFYEKQPYDLLISLAYPPVSHRTAEILILTKRVKAKKWIQIWEDPWYYDINAGGITDKIKKEEERVIGAADVVYYVSPLTLIYQKQLYPKFSGKMKWQPLPAYYEDENKSIDFTELHFGYFGDYATWLRDLEPFYRYAVENYLHFVICGNSNAPFKSVAKTMVFPRVSLEKLKPIEAETNVLVFVANLRGGQIPGKIYQYSATNKYIIFIMDGTKQEKEILYRYFSQFNRYVFCENNRDSIAKAVKMIQEGKLPDSYHTALDCFATEKIIENIIQGK